MQQVTGFPEANNLTLHRASQLLAVLASLWALSLALWTALLWYRYHPHLPWRDIYLIVSQVRSVLEGGPDIASVAAWFDLHYNAHRIAVPRALVAMDLLWFNGQNHLLYAAGWFCLALLLLIMARLLATSGWRGKTLPLFAWMLVAAYLFSPSHLWNLSNPINTSWLTCMAASALAIALVLGPANSTRGSHWLGAMCLAAVAAFSTFAGVITWLLLPLLALYLRSRWLIPVSAVCGLCVLFYCRGISSDAEILTNWSSGPAEAVRMAQEQGQAALAQHTVLQILQRGLSFLGWPLGREYPLASMVLSILSLGLVATYLAVLGRDWRRRAARPSTLVQWSVAMALLCIGIAVATQLGRVIEQPVHVQGPSEERFQTVVLLYWSCISLLLVNAGLRRGQGAGLLACLAGLVTAVLFSSPGGNYLKEEILSLEYAARLYSYGEQPALREATDGKVLAFRPERIFRLDTLLSEHQLAYRFKQPLPSPPAAPHACTPSAVAKLPPFTQRPGLRTINFGLYGPQALTVRELLLVDAGELTSRLYPIHTGNYRPISLLRTQYLEWHGFAETTQTAGDTFLLYQQDILGLRARCRVTLPDPAG